MVDFSLRPAGGQFGQGLAGIGEILAVRKEREEERELLEKERAAKAEAQTALVDAWTSKDPMKMMEASIAYPTISEQANKGLGLLQDYQKQEASDFAMEVLSNPEKAQEIAERRVQILRTQDRDPSHSADFLDSYLQNPEAAMLELKMGLAAANPDVYKAYADTQTKSELPAAMQTLELRADAAGLVPGTEEYQEFMRTGGNRSGLASAVTRTFDNGTVLQVLPDRSTQVLGPDGEVLTGQARVDALRTAREEEIDFAQARASATAQGAGEQERLQKTIDEGLDASQGVPVLRRAITLLDEVKTGGFNSAAIKAKQLFGIESADEGELSSNLGKAVLSQLKSTFGAAFTEREGARLEGIEARLGASTETNRRLLQQTLAIVERAANRAIDAAYESGDDRTARDIESMLDFTLDDEGGAQGVTVFDEADAILRESGL